MWCVACVVIVCVQVVITDERQCSVLKAMVCDDGGSPFSYQLLGLLLALYIYI